jgi:hypothetical protein
MNHRKLLDVAIGSEVPYANTIKVDIDDYAQARFAYNGILVDGLGQLNGRRFRIIVEEEVSECCAKWRGMTILGARGISVCSDPLLMVDAKPLFCPECGKGL